MDLAKERQRIRDGVYPIRELRNIARRRGITIPTNADKQEMTDLLLDDQRVSSSPKPSPVRPRPASPPRVTRPASPPRVTRPASPPRAAPRAEFDKYLRNNNPSLSEIESGLRLGQQYNDQPLINWGVSGYIQMQNPTQEALDSGFRAGIAFNLPVLLNWALSNKIIISDDTLDWMMQRSTNPTQEELNSGLRLGLGLNYPPLFDWAISHGIIISNYTLEGLIRGSETNLLKRLIQSKILNRGDVIMKATDLENYSLIEELNM